MSDRTERTDKKVSKNTTTNYVTSTLDLNNLPPLTDEELEMLKGLDVMSDEEVRRQALADPDCQPLV